MGAWHTEITGQNVHPSVLYTNTRAYSTCILYRWEIGAGGLDGMMRLVSRIGIGHTQYATHESQASGKSPYATPEWREEMR